MSKVREQWRDWRKYTESLLVLCEAEIQSESGYSDRAREVRIQPFPQFFKLMVLQKLSFGQPQTPPMSGEGSMPSNPLGSPRDRF